MHAATDMTTVPRVTYNEFETASTASTVQTDHRSNRDRYKEAMHATQTLFSELADVDDLVEFDQMLAFVLDQWRNIHQWKRMRLLSQDATELEADDPTIQVSRDEPTDATEVEGGEPPIQKGRATRTTERSTCLLLRSLTVFTARQLGQLRW